MSRIDGDWQDESTGSAKPVGSVLAKRLQRDLPDREVAVWYCECGAAVPATPVGLAALADANRLAAKRGQAPIVPRPPCQKCRAKVRHQASQASYNLEQTARAARQRLLSMVRPELAEAADWKVVRETMGEAEVRKIDAARRAPRNGDGV
jgi:hypothetical protein